MATITDLFVYPVKSARGIAQPRVRVTVTGFEWDRHWMLINGNGTFISQRTHPQLARLVPEIEADALLLHAPGVPPLRVLLAADGVAGAERRAVRVHQDQCIGVDEGDEAAEWVSRAAGDRLRLVRVPAANARRANPSFAGPEPAPVGFADGFPVLVCNRASLEDLNTRLPAAIPMDRFRPNVILSGLPAWAEDRIETLTVGELTLRLVKPCVRCTIPAVDQRTGLPGTDPTPALRQFRHDRKLHGVTFGENAVIARGTGCEIARGAACRVSFEPDAAGTA